MTEFQPIEKICRVSGKKFTIYPEDQEFYAKKGVPLPTLCPQERSRRKYSFVCNELSLYRRKCDATGKDMISIYHPGTPIKVYDKSYWQSDEFDPFAYGREYDPARSFLTQVRDLYWTVPTFHVPGVNNENTDYLTYGQGNKNSYWVGAIDTENCMYGVYVGGANCLDCYMAVGCESCYECVNCKNCYELFFGDFCADCRESSFLYDCASCHNCIMCFGLRHKSYCIKNQQLTKEEFEREKQRYNMGSHENLEKMKVEYGEWLCQFPLRENNNINCENCVGDFLIDAKNCYLCFNGTGAKDCRYCMPLANNITDCYDCCATGSQSCYEMGASVSCVNSMFGKGVYYGTDVCYSLDIMAQSHDLLGCVGLKGNNEYCILNKQYSKDEYFELRDRIVTKMKAEGEWGEYFPMTMSLFPYYDSYPYYGWPIDEERVVVKDGNVAEIDLGGTERLALRWQSRVELESGKVSGYEIADNVQEYLDENKQNELLGAVLICRQTARKYRLQSRELYFYLKFDIAVPRESYHSRHSRRVKRVMRFDIHSYNCDKCGKEVQTVYNKSVDGREVWCGECYEGIKN